MQLDAPKTLKTPDAVDPIKLAAYLGTALGALPEPLIIEQFPGGYSNLTFAVSAGDRSWVLRRPPLGVQIKSAHDMGREVRILQALAGRFDKVPKVVVACDDPAVLGAPFYMMERLRGVILRATPPKDGALSAADLRRLSEASVDTLVQIHGLDGNAPELAALGHPEGYVERQITGWAERFAKAKTDDVPSCDGVARWLAAHLPKAQTPTLIHNDFKYDNLVLAEDDLGHIIGVLDWEMATIGDPLMDLGCTLGYWVQADDPPVLQATRLCLTQLEGNLTRAELAARYAEKSGRDLTALPFYYCFGLFKIAAVAQQLYRRYKDGKTSDPRFAAMGMAVAGYLEMAMRTAESGKVSFA